MNTNKLFSVLIALMFALMFLSCQKEKEVAKPVVTAFELGLNNSGLAYIGGDIHIEAEVVADGKIHTIQVEIHPEGEHEMKSATTMAAHWEADTTYTKFSGLKNTTFHEHIEVPMDAETGHYHVHFIVTDMEGNQTTIEEEIELLIPEDNEAPVLTVTSAPDGGQVFSNGQVIRLTGSLTDNLALGGLYVGLVRTNQNLDDPSVDATNTITLLHTHDFNSPASHAFDCSITVGAVNDNNDPPKTIGGDFAWASGAYYILVKSKDAIGSNWVYSQRIPLTISL